MDRTRPARPDRGQAYTLEGFVGAIVILTAVLFAFQSVVIVPTTSGPIDRTVQAQLQQEVDDALVVAAANESDGNLSAMVRRWDDGDERFHGGAASGENGWYAASQFRNESTLGSILYERFGRLGQNYNVELHYYNETSDAYEVERLVYQGRESSGSFTASYSVALYDEQNLTASGSDDVRLPDADSYPVPERGSGDGELYNVVEVRVVVW